MTDETEIFRNLVVPHSEAMRLTCLRVLGNGDDALDALQETLVKLWNHRRSLPGLDNVGAYCRTVARNVSLTMLRSRRPDNADIDTAPQIFAATADRVADRSTLRAVERMMQQLPQSQRRALGLRCYDDLTVAEIAQLMNVSEPTVRQLLSRARKKLKELYTLHLQ